MFAPYGENASKRPRHTPTMRGLSIERLTICCAARSSAASCCHGVLHTTEIEREFGIVFSTTDSLRKNRAARPRFISDGLVDSRWWRAQHVPWLGRIFIRNIAMIFDHYLEKTQLERAARLVSKDALEKARSQVSWFHSRPLTPNSSDCPSEVAFSGPGTCRLSSSAGPGFPCGVLDRRRPPPAAVISTQEKGKMGFVASKLGPQSFLSHRSAAQNSLMRWGLESETAARADLARPAIHFSSEASWYPAPLRGPPISTDYTVASAVRNEKLAAIHGKLLRRTNPPSTDESIAAFVPPKIRVMNLLDRNASVHFVFGDLCGAIRKKLRPARLVSQKLP